MIVDALVQFLAPAVVLVWPVAIPVVSVVVGLTLAGVVAVTVVPVPARRRPARLPVG